MNMGKRSYGVVCEKNERGLFDCSIALPFNASEKVENVESVRTSLPNEKENYSWYAESKYAMVFLSHDDTEGSPGYSLDVTTTIENGAIILTIEKGPLRS